MRLDAIARWLQDSPTPIWLPRASRAAGRGWSAELESGSRASRDSAEQVSLRTFCSGWGPLVAERRTSISGNGGSVEAAALWVHLDPSTLRPARLGEEFHAVYGESAGGRRVRSRLRHPAPPPDPVRGRWRFRASDLDVAGHVNNAAYWAPVEELYAEAPEPEAADVEIEFREPGQPGDATLLREGAAMWVEDERGALLASMLGLPSPRSG